MERKTISSPEKYRRAHRLFLTFGILFMIITTAILNLKKEKTHMTEKQLIPRSVMFGNPDKVTVRTSPDGRNLSFIGPYNGVLNIFLAIDNNLENAKVITNDTHRGIRKYSWSYDNKHIIYLQDNNGDENEHLFKVNIESGEITDLTEISGVKAGISALSKDYPNYAVIMLNDRRPDLFDLHLLEINSGKRHLLYKNDKYMSIDLDDKFQLRFAAMPRPDGGITIEKFDMQERGIAKLIEMIESGSEQQSIDSLLGEIANTNVETFMDLGPEDIYTSGVVGFSQDYNKIYITDSRGQDKGALYEVDIATNAKELIFNNDKADISGIIQNPNTKVIEAISWTYAKDQIKFFDERLERIFKSIELREKGEVAITSRSVDDKVWTVAVTSDLSPGKYFRVDTESGDIQFLFSGQSSLDNYKLSPMYPVVIKARDGLDLVSYLTLPKELKVSAETTDEDIVQNIKTERPVPLVLYVHGGPTTRDEWGMDKVHQWLADRGYGVLSVNYRGSTGFGKAFINGGNGEWSRKMHDDLIDSANWAISSGIADNIAIMGGSYGGYAALVGLTYTPDFFKCGIDIVGPSNLITLLESIPAYWAPFIENLNRKTGGDIKTEEGRKELLDRSPITKVHEIKKPLLIGQGANDPRVKQAESDQIVRAMEEKNIPVIYALYSDEGHGFARPENRMSFFALTEYFLHEHMGGLLQESTPDDFNGSSLEIKAGVEELSESIKAAAGLD
jgi:dipeptidyl aminopeptidase/acylaminoacyl peptidase